MLNLDLRVSMFVSTAEYHPTERGKSGGEIRVEKQVNAVLQILFEISYSKTMSKKA